MTDPLDDYYKLPVEDDEDETEERVPEVQAPIVLTVGVPLPDEDQES